MAKAPAFQFYPGDWLSDVELQQASPLARGIWINALCRMWCSREKGLLCGSVESLSRLCNCSGDEFVTFLNEAKTLNFCDVSQKNDGIMTLINRRMYKNEKDKKFHKLRQQRYRSKKKCDAGCDGNVTPPSSSSSSIKEIHKEKKVRDGDVTPRSNSDKLFNLFWINYPRKVGKKAARKAWDKIKDPESVIQKIKTTLPKQKASNQWIKENGAFIPHPATYLNQERWEDEIE